MKIAIAIMSSNHAVSQRNTECQIETFVNNLFAKERNNEYRVYVYRGRKDADEKVGVTRKGNYYEIVCAANDSILGTFEKTYEAYLEILDTYKDLDFLVRTNISSYLNVNLLDCVMTDDVDRDLVLCNSINTVFDCGGVYMNQLFPRGDFYIIGKDNLVGALNYAPDFINGTAANHTLIHVDDVLFGMCLYEHKKGIHVYDNLHTVIYGYHPQEEIVGGKENINPFCLSYRVKTVPPGVTHSGYGWEDNVWRNYDLSKMKFLHEFLKDAKYKDIKISKLIMPDKFAKQCILNGCRYDPISVEDIKKKLISRFV